MLSLVGQVVNLRPIVNRPRRRQPARGAREFLPLVLLGHKASGEFTLSPPGVF